MTTQTHTETPRSNAPIQPTLSPAAPARREHRARDFGIGYGSSSGYASMRRYANPWGESRFRCA